MNEPWLVIVMLGAVIAGYAWMMPKTASQAKESTFVSEEAYSQLLEDLEAENRELVDAVAQFKREQDATVAKLGKRIVDMEQQLKLWSEASAESALSSSASPLSRIPDLGKVSASSDGTRYSASGQAEPAGSAAGLPAEDDRNDTIADPTPEERPSSASFEVPPTTLRGRYAELFSLHDKGRSVEQIAKSIGMNKGEVQLILQLARREEQQHA